MVLDVGGRRHKVLNSNFNIYPNTRLGKLIQARTEDEINNLCDGYKAGDIPEFFFDRNWHSFNSILDIYRTGVLHLNTDLCALVLQKDLEYWQIDELILGKNSTTFDFLMFQQEFLTPFKNTLFEKSIFCPKIQFWQKISRVFRPIFFDIFSREIKVVNS